MHRRYACAQRRRAAFGVARCGRSRALGAAGSEHARLVAPRWDILHFALRRRPHPISPLSARSSTNGRPLGSGRDGLAKQPSPLMRKGSAADSRARAERRRHFWIGRAPYGTRWEETAWKVFRDPKSSRLLGFIGLTVVLAMLLALGGPTEPARKPRRRRRTPTARRDAPCPRAKSRFSSGRSTATSTTGPGPTRRRRALPARRRPAPSGWSSFFAFLSEQGFRNIEPYNFHGLTVEEFDALVAKLRAQGAFAAHVDQRGQLGRQPGRREALGPAPDRLGRVRLARHRQLQERPGHGRDAQPARRAVREERHGPDLRSQPPLRVHDAVRRHRGRRDAQERVGAARREH